MKKKPRVQAKALQHKMYSTVKTHVVQIGRGAWHNRNRCRGTNYCTVLQLGITYCNKKNMHRSREKTVPVYGRKVVSTPKINRYDAGQIQSTEVRWCRVNEWVSKWVGYAMQRVIIVSIV